MCVATRFLFAVTTGLPCFKLASTSCRASSVPPNGLHGHIDIAVSDKLIPIGKHPGTHGDVFCLHAWASAHSSNIEPNSAALSDQIGMLGNNLRRRPTDCAEACHAYTNSVHGLIRSGTYSLVDRAPSLDNEFTLSAVTRALMATSTECCQILLRAPTE
jgi:hypothetical protein